ncbi:MAG: hypothetical protein HQK96_09350 [Nitrospirae bacterium]|nr:hypothetical protein [Nitrospirota bacterium]
MAEEDGVKWGITAVHDKAVKALIKSIEEAMWYEPVRGCGYEIAETVHCMNKTEFVGKTYNNNISLEDDTGCGAYSEPCWESNLKADSGCKEAGYI